MSSSPQQKPRVYRVRNLPKHHDRLSAQELLSDAFKLEQQDIRVFSLATVVNQLERPQTKTATVIFRKAPKIIEKEPRSSEWTVELKALEKPLIIDSHFLGITPLNDVAEVDHRYDCIAISGLASHPFGSWQPHAGDKSFMWIRDELPRQLPGVRAILYGYDTTLVNSRSFQTIPDLSLTLIDELKTQGWTSSNAKPITFLAHSLGGVILKQALIQLAGSGEREKLILSKIKGGIFFGVPSGGMKMGQLMSMMSSQPNHSLVKDLSTESNYLTSVQEQLSGIAYFGRMRIFWAYETKTTAPVIQTPNGLARDPNGEAEVSVTRESATCGLCLTDPTLTIQIDEDHSSIVKYPLGDHRTQIVLRKLREVLEIVMGADVDLQGQELDSLSNNSFEEESGVESECSSTYDIWDARKVKESIRPPRRDDRLHQIEEKFSRTFAWIYEAESVGFVEWLRSDESIYWINGKPGSGKSTLMKFIYNDARTNGILRRWGKNVRYMTASFFFHHRGTLIQKSFEGLLRSIASQILESQSDLIPLLYPLLDDRLSQKLTTLGLHESLSSDLRGIAAAGGGEVLEKTIRDISDRQKPRFQVRKVFADLFATIEQPLAIKLEDFLLVNKWTLIKLNSKQRTNFVYWVYDQLYTHDGASLDMKVAETWFDTRPRRKRLDEDEQFISLGRLVGEWISSQNLKAQIHRHIFHGNLVGNERIETMIQRLEKRQERRERIQAEIGLSEWSQSWLEGILLALVNQKLFDLDICFFFDALDEYDGPKEFISSFLKDPVQRGPDSRTRVRICFSSRPWKAFQDEFRTYPGFAIHEYTQNDIRDYCSGSIMADRHAAPRLSPMVSEIVRRAEGVFLWVKLVLSDLKKASRHQTPEQLKETLDALPDELDKYYSLIIERVGSGSPWETFVVLESIVKAKQPLTIDNIFEILECSYAATYQDGIEAMTKAKANASLSRKAKEQKLQAITGGLAECIPDSRVKRPGTRSQEPTNRQSIPLVQLMHQTANEFINNPQFKHATLGEGGKVMDENGHTFLSKFYLLSLKHISIAASPGDSDPLSITVHHAREAERTTGKPQYGLLSSIPEDTFADERVGSREVRLASLEEFAMYAGLDLFLHEWAQNNPSPFRKCSPAITSLIVSRLDFEGRPQDMSRLELAERVLFLVENGLNISISYGSVKNITTEIWRYPLDDPGPSGHVHRREHDVLTEILIKDIENGVFDEAKHGIWVRGFGDVALIHFSTPRLAQCLLQHGATPNVLTKENETAMDFILNPRSPHQLNKLPLQEIYELMQILAESGGLLNTTKSKAWEAFLESCRMEGFDIDVFKALNLPQWMPSMTKRVGKAKRVGGKILGFLGRRSRTLSDTAGNI